MSTSTTYRFGPPPGSPRTPTLSFTIAGWTPAAAAARLSADWGLYLSHGNFYASRVTERLGVEPEGLLRAGPRLFEGFQRALARTRELLRPLGDEEIFRRDAPAGWMYEI